MTSHGGSDQDGGVWQNTNPFGSDQAESTGDDDNRLTGVRSVNPFAKDQAQSAADDDHRLTGVRSTNSFTEAESGTREQIESAPVSAVSPGAGSAAAANTEYFDRAVSGTNEQSDSSPTSAPSPGAGVLTSTQAVDHAVSATSEKPTSNDAPDTNLETVNSNTIGDRAERGTDVFANADPPKDEDHSNGQSGKESDSDSDSGRKDEKRGVTFAEKGDIDKVPTQSDSSPDILDKVKTTLSNVKSKIHLQEISATGPFKKMNPTNVRMRLRFEDDPERDVGMIWRSRDNRKGRNSVVIPRTSMAYPNLPTKNRPVYSSSFKGVRRNLYRMAFTFPYWDMAFWSGWSYTWGSVLFVIDGVWAWIPVGWPDTYLNPGIDEYAIGIFFFVGALLYQLGATIAWLEAVNDGSFHGSAMKRFLEGHEEDKKKMLDDKVKIFFGHLNPLYEKKRHEAEEAELTEAKSVDPEAGWKSVHRRERPGSIYPTGQKPGPRRGGVDLGEAEEGETHEYLQWRWWPTWHAFRYHHIYEIGYIATSIQLFGATLYTWCGLSALHGIGDNFNSTQYYAAYWMPEILGSCCFLTASVIFLVETQEKWYKPKPHIMGWWIGFWAMIGSWGFLLNGLFGVVAQDTDLHWAEFQSECATTWGSFGYLCSSLCQWYEAVNKHPVEEGYFDDSGNLKTFQVHDT